MVPLTEPVALDASPRCRGRPVQRGRIPEIHAGLADPAGQAARRKAEPLGDGLAGEAIL